MNFVVQYETFLETDWHAVVRYDLAHNFFHRDIMNHKGEKEKQTLPIENLKDALNFAEQDLKDRWESYREGFYKNLKKKR